MSTNKAYKYAETGASTLVKTGPGVIKGFYVSSTGGGTVRFWDNTVLGGTAITVAMAAPVGWHEFANAEFITGLYVGVTGGSIKVTVVYQ